MRLVQLKAGNFKFSKSGVMHEVTTGDGSPPPNV